MKISLNFRILSITLVALLLLLSSYQVLASIPFGSQTVISTATDGPTSVLAVDLDTDGDLDILSSSFNDNKIAWYENTNGAGSFGPQQVITNTATSATSVYAADIDADGDFDVLSASFGDNKIAWYENDGSQNFASHTITTIASGASSVYAADLDRDGDLDVLSASALDNKIAWYENTDGAGSFGSQQTIFAGAAGATSVYAADLDRDGDLDVLSASFNLSQIAWYENADGAGSFGPPQIISNATAEAFDVYAADLDRDGDLDVLSASRDDNKIAWYENTDGNGAFGSQQIISTATDGPTSVFAIDIDTDGDLDVLSTSANDNKIAWYENINGNGAFGSQQIISTAADGPTSVYAADLDKDGDLDLLSSSGNDNKIAWYQNNIIHSGDIIFSNQKIISTEAEGAWFVYAADLDKDADLDVLSASQNDSKIAWYENTDGAGSFGPQQILSDTVFAATSVYAADLDRDADNDVLSASLFDDKIAWYENTDGAGSFGSQQVINTPDPDNDPLNATNGDANYAFSVYAADIDKDGDLDVLSASRDDDKIAWYENTDGAGSFGSQQVINTPDPDSDPNNGTNGDANGALFVYAADIDNDGDVDVLSASFHDHKIAWYENTDGAGSFGSQQVISTTAMGATAVYAADIDKDGDLDVLSASSTDSKIAWYENTDGNGSFGSQQVITNTASFAWSVYATDFDQDGDTDVFSASQQHDLIAWYENDGAQNFTVHTVSTAADGATTVYVADLDRDGKLDILSASKDDNKIAWYREFHLTHLPILIKPPTTDLSVKNINAGNLTFTVLGTGVSCQVPNNTTQFCGSFPSGTYTVKAEASCGTSFATKVYAPGSQTTNVTC